MCDRLQAINLKIQKRENISHMSNSGKVTNTVPSHPPHLSGVAQEPKQVKSTSRISVGPGGELRLSVIKERVCISWSP